MASRLSEQSLSELYDGGCRSFALADRATKASLPNTLAVDFDQMLAAPNPAEVIQSLPAQQLYQSLMAAGREDHLTVLKLISKQQWQRLADYSGWHEDRLLAPKIFGWLELYRQVSPETLFLRIKELEEELAIALLGPLIEIYTEEEIEGKSDEFRDGLRPMPCRQVFYRIKTDNQLMIETIDALVEAASSLDVNYLYTLFATAAYTPPNEQEELALRFRNARLEEDGFVSYEESLTSFHPIDVEALKAKWSGRTQQGTHSPIKPNFCGELLEQCMREVNDTTTQQSFLALANALCAAAKIEPDDTQGLQTLLRQAYGLCNLGLETLSGGDLSVARRILGPSRDPNRDPSSGRAGEHPRTLFRVGLSEIRKIQQTFLTMTATLQWPGHERYRRLSQNHRPGALLAEFDHHLVSWVGFEGNEEIKAFFNRFPMLMVPETQTRDRLADQSGEEQKLKFVPISTRQELRSASSGLEALLAQSAMLRNVAKDDSIHNSWSWEEQFDLGFANLLLSDRFQLKELSPQDVDRLATTEGVESALQEFFSSCEGHLESLKDQWLMTDHRDGQSLTRALDAISNRVLRFRMRAQRRQWGSLASESHH